MGGGLEEVNFFYNESKSKIIFFWRGVGGGARVSEFFFKGLI